MSDRERWVIYPLLLFAISPTLKDIVQQPTELKTRVVECNQLTVKSFDGKPWVQINGAYKNAGKKNAGMVVLYGANEKPAVVLDTDEHGALGIVETRNADGDRVALMGANPGGGMLQLVGQESQTSLIVGYQKELQLAGLLAIDRHEKLIGVEVGEKFVPWGSPLRWQSADTTAPDASPPPPDTAPATSPDVPGAAATDTDAAPSDAPPPARPGC